MTEYPKALYQGNPDNYTTKVVNDSDEEFTAKKEGFVEFCYLGKPVKKTKKANTTEAIDNGDNELHDIANSDSKLATSE